MPEITFTKLRLQVSEKGHEWEDYRAEDPILTHLIERRSNRQELRVEQLWGVINAFEQGAEFIPPKNEFVVNSLEHLQEGKYRLAIIECATGLEITLTEVADDYLFFQTLMPEKYREDFLWSPQVGLMARLKGLLFLLLRDEDFRKFRIKDVVTLVEWRNRFIHGPKRKDEGEQRIWPKELRGLSDEERYRKIWSHWREVVNLILVLESLMLDLGSADDTGIRPRKVSELDEELRPKKHRQ